MRIGSAVIGFVLATLIELGAYAESPCAASPLHAAVVASPAPNGGGATRER